MSRLEAVTFDFWDTLVRTDGPSTRRARALAVTAALEASGHAVDTVALDRAFEQAFAEFNDAWGANRQFTARHAAELVVAALGLPLEPSDRDAAIDAYVLGAADIDMHLTGNLQEVLVALKQRGLRLGIICDVGLTPSVVLRGYLDAHGVLDLFDHWSFSDEVGAYKPAAEIFEHALAGLGGTAPDRAAHVGDLRRTDVAGARAMGMTSVRYRGANDDPAVPGVVEADHVIDDHAELLGALGLI